MRSAQIIPFLIMRLLTHNFVKCVVKECLSKDSFPLSIAATMVEMDEESDYVPDTAKHLLSKIHYPALKTAVSQIGIMDALPNPIEQCTSVPALQDDQMKIVYDTLMGVHVMEGSLECPNCKRKYPITQGIPNMLLREDEV